MKTAFKATFYRVVLTLASLAALAMAAGAGKRWF